MLEEKRKQARDAERVNRKQLQERIEKARQRPLLIESIQTKKHNENLARIKATKETIKILAETGINPAQYLNDEDKEILEQAEFIERRKKELGFNS